MVSSNDLKAGDNFGNWRILSFHDEGKSARIYRAEPLAEPGIVCALKIYRTWVAEGTDFHDVRERLDRHLAFKSFQCPYLVRIIDVGEAQGVFFVAMEWITGTNLDKYRGKIPIDRIRPLLSQIATAVEYLNCRSIFHRDIKPANIMVSRDFSMATLTDLGVIGMFEERSSATGTGEFLGTKRYSPPEFIRIPNLHESAEIDAVNFYQLGAVAYELITRKMLFSRVPVENEANLMDAIDHDKVVPTLDELIDPSLSDVAALVTKALSKNSSDRNVKYQDFIFVEGAIQPTIIFLYAGGTIASKSSPANVNAVRVIEGPEDSLLKTFTARIKRDYKFFHTDHQEMPFEIRWEAMTGEHQILSENASLVYWQALATKIAGLLSEPCPGRYLLGIVVLHGTDTLAYSAAALTFALTHLPCPVVLTGSNQPPNEDDIWETDPVAARSDVWRNLLGSIRFLETFGHRHPEVWVSFSDTVLLAVNVRKTVEPSLASPGSHLDVNTVLDEPFTFRRPEPHARYDFRAIDGTYVNNFYPTAQQQGYRRLISIEGTHWRHNRPAIKTGTAVEHADLSGHVVLYCASPGAATAMPALPDRDSRVVLLVDGYSSGTFPNISGHSATMLLRDTVKRSVPIVVISEDGLLPSISDYQVDTIDGAAIPVIRLFGIVRESAVPLLHRMLSKISEETWRGSKDDNERLIDVRVSLLRSTLDEYLRTDQNVANLMLGLLTDRVALRRDLAERLEFRFGSGTHGLEELLNGIAQAPEQEEWRAAVASFRDLEPSAGTRRTTAILPRPLLAYLLGEAFRLHELAGAGPDAMECAYELGYRVGQSLMAYQRQVQTRGSVKLFYNLLPIDRERLLSNVKQSVEQVINLVCSSGLADVKVTNIELPDAEPSKDLANIGMPPGHLGFRLSVNKHGLLTREDELFSVHVATTDDRGFFEMLRQGIPFTSNSKAFNSKAFEASLERTLNELYKSTWRRKLSVMDWIVVGLGRAVMVDAAGYLSTDDWVEKCTTSGGRQLGAVRAAVGMDIEVASKEELVVSYRYVPRLRLTAGGQLEG